MLNNFADLSPEAIELIERLETNIINPLIILLFVAAGVYFTWGLLLYIKNADSEQERKKGASHMLWAVIGFFVMVSVFAIIRIVLNSLGIPVIGPI